MPDETEQRLLEAAGRVFADFGFKAATVRKILEEAGIKNIAAVNYYFGDKERLYEATLRFAFQCGLSQMPNPQWPAGYSPECKLREYIRLLAQHMLNQKHPWQMQLLLREFAQPSEAGAGVVRDFILPLNRLLWSILHEAIGPDVDERKLHLIGFSIIGQIFHQKIGAPVIRLVVGENEHDGYTAEVLAEHVADFSLKALGLTAPKEVHS
ncbi:MAG: CerR family C-terminal domain-containing protein [Gemmataceae bacterium]|nr:CerR family C-terminal domain-containing protein [Gemmataceae bacterium]